MFVLVVLLLLGHVWGSNTKKPTNQLKTIIFVTTRTTEISCKKDSYKINVNKNTSSKKFKLLRIIFTIKFAMQCSLCSFVLGSASSLLATLTHLATLRRVCCTCNVTIDDTKCLLLFMHHTLSIHNRWLSYWEKKKFQNFIWWINWFIYIIMSCW